MEGHKPIIGCTPTVPSHLEGRAEMLTSQVARNINVPLKLAGILGATVCKLVPRKFQAEVPVTGGWAVDLHGTGVEEHCGLHRVAEAKSDLPEFQELRTENWAGPGDTSGEQGGVLQG